MPLLTQNRELKPHGIWNFSIPAWYTRLTDGSLFVTCPHAGACAKVCYARNGTYLFPKVKAAHRHHLELFLTSPVVFEQALLDELAHKRFRPTGKPRVLPPGVDMSRLEPGLRKWLNSGGRAVRIHDSGDFFSTDYLRTWISIARQVPDVLFYAYTKEVLLFKAERNRDGGGFPPNFRYLFSTGGLQDDMIQEHDRHADVFPNEQVMAAAGYTSQDASDLMAVLLPTNRIGIPANNIPHFNKKMAGRRFSEM